MTDYEQMTDTELQRVIAERLGWTCKTESHGSRTVHKLYTPAGHYMVQVWTQGGSSVWSNLVEYLPNWPQDANTALELLNKFMTLSITIEWNSILAKWSCRILLAHRLLPIDAKSTTLARAISIAWLRWKATE
jgi:hypothetical protein